MRRKIKKKGKIYTPAPKGNKTYIDWGNSTYKLGHEIDDQQYYVWQGIGQTAFQHPGVYCDVNYTSVVFTWDGLILISGWAGVQGAETPDFSVDADGNLVVDRVDEDKFFIDYDNATLNYSN